MVCDTYWANSSMASFSALLTKFGIVLLSWVLSDMMFHSPAWTQISCFIFVFGPDISRESFLGDTYFGAKLTFTVTIFFLKLTLMLSNPFPCSSSSFVKHINLYYVQNQHQNHLQAVDLLRCKPYFLKNDPQWLGPMLNFNINRGFRCRRPVFPDYLFVSCDYHIIMFTDDTNLLYKHKSISIFFLM